MTCQSGAGVAAVVLYILNKLRVFLLITTSRFEDLSMLNSLFIPICGRLISVVWLIRYAFGDWIGSTNYCFLRNLWVRICVCWFMLLDLWYLPKFYTDYEFTSLAILSIFDFNRMQKSSNDLGIYWIYIQKLFKVHL